MKEFSSYNCGDYHSDSGLKLIMDVEVKDAVEGEAISGTPYKIYKNTENAFEEIDRRLFEYNKRCVPATQSPEVVEVSYIVKQEGVVVAGIQADIYIWKVLHVNVLYVDEQFRGGGLGALLLRKVESDAKAMGVKLAHLDTFEFQAKDFYLKTGYEVFGVLDDCPEGYQRFYMKKVLK